MRPITKEQCLKGRTTNADGTYYRLPLWLDNIKMSLAAGERKMLRDFEPLTISKHISNVVQRRYMGTYGTCANIADNATLRQLKVNCARSFGLEYEGE